MKKLIVFVLFLLVVLLGAVMPLSFEGTVGGLRSAVAGESGTAIYHNGGNLYMFVFPHRATYAFATLTSAGRPVDVLRDMKNGQYTDLKSAVDMVKFVERSGWQQILPEQLPVGLREVLSSWSLYLVSVGARAFGLPIIVLPIGVLDNTMPWGSVDL